MPEWLIIAVGLWLVLRLTRRSRYGWRGGCRRLGRHDDRRLRHGRYFERRYGREPGEWRWRRDFPVEAEPTRSMRRAERDRSLPRETVEERLRREFVEGELTLEEYEERLWEELKPRSAGVGSVSSAAAEFVRRRGGSGDR